MSGLCLALFSACYIVDGIRGSLQTKIIHPVEFRLRHWLGRDPKLDPRIKVYALGDSTVNYLGDTDLSLKEWAKVFVALGQRYPQAILIDRLFGNPMGLEDAPQFVRALQGTGVKIISGAFTTSQKITAKPMLELNHKRYQAQADQETQNVFVYGPNARIQSAFSAFGFLNYTDDNYLPLSQTFDEGKKIIFPAAFYLKDDLTTVPHDSKNRILVNLPDPQVLRDNLFALKSVIEDVRQSKTLSEKKIPSHSVIVILPGMYTGNADIHQTAHGAIAGGYIQIAMVNSVLTGNWLKFLPGSDVLAVAFVFLGAALAYFFTGISFWLVIGATGLLTFTLGIFGFAFLSVVSPWFFCMFALLLSGTVVFADRSILAEIQGAMLSKDLELGQQTQSLFLPKQAPGTSETVMGEIAYHFHFEPFGAMSGDWLQVMDLPGCSLLALGDVVGKGPAAALNTAVIASVFATTREKWGKQVGNVDVEKFLGDLNHSIYCLFKGKQFTTLSLACVRGTKLSLYSFGAPPWLLVQSDFSHKALAMAKQNPVGVFATLGKVTPLECELREGEIYFAYSDGVMDAPGERRAFGKALLHKRSQISPNFLDVLFCLKQASQAKTAPKDDQTVVMIRRRVV